MAGRFRLNFLNFCKLVRSSRKFSDEREKMKMKENADKKSRAKFSNIEVGDSVLIYQRKRNKLSSKFDPSPFHMVRKKGTMITVV